MVIRFLQVGHDLEILATCLMHPMQNICPHTVAPGTLFPPKTSKQMGQVRLSLSGFSATKSTFLFCALSSTEPKKERIANLTLSYI